MVVSKFYIVPGFNWKQQHLLGGETKTGTTLCGVESTVHPLQRTSPYSVYEGGTLRMPLGA